MHSRVNRAVRVDQTHSLLIESRHVCSVRIVQALRTILLKCGFLVLNVEILFTSSVTAYSLL